MNLLSFFKRSGKKTPDKDAPETDEDSPATDEDSPAMDEEDEDAATNDGAAAKVSLGLRFKAWWNGEDIKKLMAREALDAESDDEDEFGETPEEADEENVAGAAETAAAPTDPYEGLWTDTRLEIAEMVWGEGFIGPGGEEYVHELAIPLALNSKQTALDLGAGLGGPARYISNEADLWITAMEPCQFLVDAGIERATIAGMAKKAAMEKVDMEDLELRKNKYNCIFSKDVLYTVRNKKQLFKTIHLALKKGGQLMLIDYMLPKTDAITTEVKNWALAEEVRPTLWSNKQVREFLEKLGFTIRIEEDISDSFRARLMAGWAEFIAELRHKDFHGKGRLAGEKGELLIEEVERWLRREKALASGDVRIFRFHAFKNI